MRSVIQQAMQGLFILSIAGSMGACQTAKEYPSSAGHIGVEAQPVQHNMVIAKASDKPPPIPIPTDFQSNQDTYTVMVSEVPVQELLFALARDAELNLDILGRIEGLVTINAIDQTLPKILERLGKQSNIRYQIVGQVLEVSTDTPYLKTYSVPYLNMSRSSRGSVSLSVELAATGTAGDKEGVARTNNSSASIANTSKNEFWNMLGDDLQRLLSQDFIQSSSTQQSSNVVVNSIAGLVTISATQRQHHYITKYLNKVINSARRQVLIEATIIEVNLSSSFNSGIDWSRVSSRSGLRVDQDFTRSNLDAAPESFNISYIDRNSAKTMTSTLKLLEQFGNVKVLSSPKIMALNNQPSILKVVDNRVYFRLEVDTSETSGGTTNTTIETEINSVPVGFMMSMTPYIGEDGEIILNIRPTISRILRFVNDPNPILAANNISSPVPEIQVREMETVLRLNSGQVAVLGGLMQDTANNSTDQLPGLATLPIIGRLFKGTQKEFSKSELVVFLRPLRIRDPSLEGDLKEFKQYLPSTNAPIARLGNQPLSKAKFDGLQVIN